MGEPIVFRSVVELGGKTATGIPVPEDVVTALGSGRRPAVRVTLGGHTYRTTVAPMGGRFFVPLSATNRTEAGVGAGDEVAVEIEPDTAPREVELPDELRAALADNAGAAQFFDGLSITDRKEWARWIAEAKRPETRRDRLDKTLSALTAGQRRRR